MNKISEPKPLEFFKIAEQSVATVPYPQSFVPAGFPSPADDYIELTIDLNKTLIDKAHSTFIVRVKGSSMIDAKISDGDILIVDRAKEPASGKIIVAVLNGEFTVKHMLKKNGEVFLLPANKSFSPIKITNEMEFAVWGVVTYIIHKV